MLIKSELQERLYGWRIMNCSPLGSLNAFHLDKVVFINYPNVSICYQEELIFFYFFCLGRRFMAEFYILTPGKIP